MPEIALKYANRSRNRLKNNRAQCFELESGQIFGSVLNLIIMSYLVFSVVFSLFYGVTSGHQPIERQFGGTLKTNINGIKYRLPNNTKPMNYDITLITSIDKNEFNFSGVAIIGLLVLETSSNITLHARQLTIKSVKLATTGGTMINLNPFTYNRTTEFLIISTQNQLLKDSNYILIIEYMGELRNDQFGFYRSSYVNSKGETKQV